MEIYQHSIISIILTVVLWPLYGPWALLAIVGGVLIDSDHVLWYWAKSNKFNIKKTYSYCQNVGQTANIKEYKQAWMPFHSYEALLALMILSIIFPQSTPLLIGLLLHLLLDFFWVLYNWKDMLFFHLFCKSGIVFFYLWFKGSFRKH